MKKKLKAIKIMTIISGIIACIAVIYNYALPWIIKLKIIAMFNSSDAHAIGIIGGADGPTSIYVSVDNKIPGYIFMVVFIVITIIGVLLYRKNKDKV